MMRETKNNLSPVAPTSKRGETNGEADQADGTEQCVSR